MIGNYSKEFFLIAKVIAVFGTDGFVSVISFSDDENRFFELKSVFIEVFGGKRKFFIEEVKKLKNSFIVKFSNFDSSEEVKFLVGSEIFIETKDSIILEKNSFFIHDLIDCKVFLKEDFIGTLKDVVNLPANDIYVVITPEEKEILIPAVKEFIEKFDEESKRLFLKSECRMILNDEN